jgi:hypothetical protein
MKEYKEFEVISQETDFSGGYEGCMLNACEELGLTDIKVYYDGYGGYSGTLDIHVEAKYKGKNIYYYLSQDYGSCSYCDWLEGSSDEEVIEKYKEYLKEALGVLE